MVGALALAALILSGCPGNGGGGSTVDLSGGSHPAMTDSTAPGIDFAKKSTGLPSHTLDFITAKPSALAGARGGRKIFFGADDNGLTRVYVRNVDTLERKLLMDLHDLLPNTLVSSVDGRYLVYCRQRAIESYIDDPLFNFPSRISLAFRYDVETGEEQPLFNFRDETWRKYRSNQQSPFISQDGSRIYILAYDIDRLALKQQLSDWLAIEADLRDRGEEMSDEERTGTADHLRRILNSAHVRERLELDEIQESGAPTPEERDAVAELFTAVSMPEGALLIWDNGETRILPLTFSEDRANVQHYILAAGNHTVLMVAPVQLGDPTMPEPVFSVDLATGQISECFSFQGTPSLLELDADAQNVIMIVNPPDAAAGEVTANSQLSVIPLDGSPLETFDLGGDYQGLANVTSDHQWVVGQAQDNQSLYRINVASGERQLLKELMQPVESIFVVDGADKVVYSDSGVLFQLDVPDDPKSDPGWLDDSYVEPYMGNVREFFTKLGFDVPEDLDVKWEEREGLDSHEFALELHNPARPDRLALLRYEVDTSSVISLWYPRGYLFDIEESMRGENLDYYGVEDLVEQALDRLGWLDPDTRTIYQPGPNPIYDGRTDSYVVVFRDGYWLGEGDDAVWAYNKEATMRVHAADGSFAEMTLSEFPPIMNQPRTFPLERAVFNIRNQEGQAIPEDAPVRFDTDNVRLIVHQQGLDHWTDAGYERALVNRLCYEIDAYIQPEDALVWTFLVDTETGKVLGQIDFMPKGVR
jgi:hypothetical protein